MKFDAHEWLKEKKIYRDDYMRKMDLIQEKIKNRIVLDAGCGKGYKTNYFSKFANKMVMSSILCEIQQGHSFEDR